MSGASFVSGHVMHDIPRTYLANGLSCKRWIAGSAGLTVAICAIAFMILGCMQPDGFLRSVGTVGDPISWPLWTISGGGIIVGGLLMAYAGFSRKHQERAQQERVSQPANVEKSSKKTLKLFQLNNAESDFVKKSFHSKITLEELLADEGSLLSTIDDYGEALSRDGVVETALMSQSVVKGYFVGNVKVPFIAFKLHCVSDDQKMLSHLNTDLELQNLSAFLERSLSEIEIKDFKEHHIEKCKTRPALLLFWRNKSRWMQWWVPYNREYSKIMPSFLPDHVKGGRLGPEQAPGWENEAYIQKQEEGFSNLKKLMRGERGIDHNGLEWELVT